MRIEFRNVPVPIQPWEEKLIDFVDKSVFWAQMFSQKERKNLRQNLDTMDTHSKKMLYSVLRHPSLDSAFLKTNKPSHTTKDAILFMETPARFELDKDFVRNIYDSENNDILPPISRNEDFETVSPSHRFLEKVWLEIVYFRNSKFKPDWLMDSSTSENTITEETQALRNRFGYNFQSAIEALVNGYKDEKTGEPDLRRTGEETWVHPLRVFLRTAKEFVPRLPEKDWWVIYTSYLAALLHDCREDKDFFNKFDISKKESGNNGFDKYTLSYLKNGEKQNFDLLLNDKEYEILHWQLLGFTSPNSSSETQFKYLIHNASELINRKQNDVGIYAAIMLLIGKTQDRLDNIITYWTMGKSEEDDKKRLKKKLNAKLIETITYFESIEEITKSLIHFETSGVLPGAPREDYYFFLKSAVDLCYAMLLGGTYDEIFASSLADFEKEHHEVQNGPKSKEEQFKNDRQLFIVNPYNLYSATFLV